MGREKGKKRFLAELEQFGYSGSIHCSGPRFSGATGRGFVFVGFVPSGAPASLGEPGAVPPAPCRAVSRERVIKAGGCGFSYGIMWHEDKSRAIKQSPSLFSLAHFLLHAAASSRILRVLKAEKTRVLHACPRACIISRDMGRGTGWAEHDYLCKDVYASITPSSLPGKNQMEKSGQRIIKS